MANKNIDEQTVAGFGREWAAFDQTAMPRAEADGIFDQYFAHFPFEELPKGARGFDLGCGSGRWAARVATQVGHLACIDASAEALAVARRNLHGQANVSFLLASVEAIPLPDSSQDFGYSLGVLHHVPDTAAGIAACVRKLKPGAPFLLYLYYRFDNRPGWFRALWRASDLIRRALSAMPFRVRIAGSNLLAALVYWPLARLSRLAERLGRDVTRWPLSAYRGRSFYTMRTDALDRFGTRLEQRFTRAEIEAMMRSAGLVDIRFNEREAFWTAVGRRAGSAHQ